MGSGWFYFLMFFCALGAWVVAWSVTGKKILSYFLFFTHYSILFLILWNEFPTSLLPGMKLPFMCVVTMVYAVAAVQLVRKEKDTLLLEKEIRRLNQNLKELRRP